MFEQKSIKQYSNKCEKCSSEIITTDILFSDNEKKTYDQLAIYVITTVEKIERNSSKFLSVDFGDQRTVGFFNSFKDADYAVQTNSCNIFEDLYRYALIEKTIEGIYPNTIIRWLYRYNYISEKYEELPKKSEEYKLIEHIANFGIG